MPKQKPEPEVDHRALALQVVDLFYPDEGGEADLEANDQKIIELLAGLDPVDAAAVAVEVCLELSPEEIAEWLDFLEGGDEEPEDEEPEGE